ncbi:MAG: hypothetical protein Q9217_006484 [Psora testacea]
MKCTKLKPSSARKAILSERGTVKPFRIPFRALKANDDEELLRAPGVLQCCTSRYQKESIRPQRHEKAQMASSKAITTTGFFFQPTTSCPDNVTCYLCRSNLDGWEDDDNPIDEHLKHSSGCGWAVAVFVERAIEHGDRNVEDPMSEAMIEARRMTFGTMWPHENKRGWLCKIRKRRSPDCMFFNSAIAVKPKKGRAKKERSSKASRLSTQSCLIVASEEASLAETEAQGDESMLSIATTATSAKGKRGPKDPKVKKPKAKSKNARSNIEESQFASSCVEPEDDDFSVKVDQSPEPAFRGKKRKSDDTVVEDNAEVHVKEDPSQAPRTKRRATGTRSSVAVQDEISKSEGSIDDQDVNMANAEVPSVPSTSAPRKGRKGAKKGTSSSQRKASTTSVASKASLRVGVPDDDEIEAALEFDLEHPLTDEEREPEPADIKQPKARRLTRTKPGTKTATASVAPTQRGTRARTLAVDNSVMIDHNHNGHNTSETQATGDISQGADTAVKDQADAPGLQEDAAKGSTARKPSGKRKARAVKEENVQKLHPPDEAIAAEEPHQTRETQDGRRQVSRQLPTKTTGGSIRPASKAALPAEPDAGSPTVDLQIHRDDAGHETDASANSEGRATPTQTATVKKGKKSKKPAPTSHHIEDIIPTTENLVPRKDQTDMESEAVDEADKDEITQEEVAKPKKQPEVAKTAPKAGKGKRGAAKSKAAKKELTPVSSPADRPATPQSVPAQPTPAASMQSSDAENQPPSSRPSQLHPPLATQSPSISQAKRIPLAASTPTRSPSKNTFSKLQSTMPWTAVDLEQIFQGTPSVDKENDPFGFDVGSIKGALTSPEKKLTVEQWIHLNAHRGEENLRAECERLVSKFEGEGMRALKTLEGIVCAP